MKRTFTNIICILIIFGILAPSLAMASLSDYSEAPECRVKNLLRKVLEDVGRAIKKFLASSIKAALCKVGGAALTATSATIILAVQPIPVIGQIIGGIIAGISFLFSRCGVDKTQDAGGAQNIAKEIVYDVVTRCTAFGMLQQIENSILEKARKGGRDGDATWVRDWRNFQLEAQYRGEGIFRGMLASNQQLCNYFGGNIKNLFGANQKVSSLTKIKTRTNSFDSFDLQTGCTLPKNFDFNAYKKDFSGNGGWEAWSRLLEPQNNFYGVFFQALDEADKQRALEESTDLNQVLANRGFTGISGDNKADSCLVKDPNGKCLKYKDIRTPGSVVGASVDATIQSTLNWIVSSDEFNELMGDLTDRLVSRLFNLAAPDKKTPVELQLEAAGGSYVQTQVDDPLDICLNVCAAQYCTDDQGNGNYSCSNAGPEYNTCINACYEDVGPPVPNDNSGEGANPPPDALQKHPDKSSVVAEAKAEAKAAGFVYSKSSPECPDRFEITKRAAWKLQSEGGGLLSKTSGNNCQGYAVDIIAYPDGYIYDILNGTAPDGNGPMWNPAGCGPASGNGTCPDRYRPVIAP